MKKTQQMHFWEGDFGKNYTDRNTFDRKSWDDFYLNNYGITKLEMNNRLLSDLPKDAKILEVGCNIGLQLRGLQDMGFTQLYGVELQEYAVEKAKSITSGINIIQGSGLDLPFKDNYFDLVCTNGVLIHISPVDLPTMFSEIYRCSKKYIMGFEYYHEELVDINYRGNAGFLWKADYAALYKQNHPSLKLVKQEIIPFISEAEKGNRDAIFLLEK